MLKVISWIKYWVVYRYAAGKLIVACSWCRAVARSDGLVVARRTGRVAACRLGPGGRHPFVPPMRQPVLHLPTSCRLTPCCV